MIRIAIVDDHQIFIDGLKELIKLMPNMKVVGEANDGVGLIDLLSKTKSDVVLMDVNMPKMGGIEATKIVRNKHPHVKILMLTMHDSKEYIQKVLKAGAHGYLLKNTEIKELKTAIESVIGGKSFFSAEVTKTIMSDLQGEKSSTVKLTAREIDVLKLIAEEMTTAEIGEALFISPHTVESHRKNLISKLGVRSSSGLVKYAVQKGLVD